LNDHIASLFDRAAARGTHADGDGVFEAAVRRLESPTPETANARPERHRVPAWAVAGVAAVAVLVVVGLPILLFSGGESIVADQPATTVPLTVATVSPATVAPSVTTVAPVLLAYDEVLDGSVAAIRTSIALASDGSPVIASYASDVDIFGDEETTISVIRLVMCLDPQCAEPPVVVDLADVEWQGDGPYLTVDPFDRPVVGYHDAQGPTIVFCADPECTAFETRRVEEAEISVSGWAFGADGNPIYTESIYPEPQSLEPQSLDLVTCLDRFCDASSSTRIDTGLFIVSSQTPRVGPDGSVLVVYALDEPIGPPDPETGYDGDDFFGTQKVAWCADAACTSGPVITPIDEGINVGGGALFGGGAGAEIWFVEGLEAVRTPTGPEDEHLAVSKVSYGKATCLNAACTEFEMTHLGPYEMAGSSSSLLPYGLPETVAPDGSRMDLRLRESTLVLERFSEAEGGTWWLTTLATFELGGFDWGRGASLVIGSDDLPIVVYGDDTGVHIIRCPDLACTPPDSG
jgi:hypothetical protein